MGGKTLREIYEVANHARAFNYVKDCIAKEKPLDEQIIKDIHARIMENIQIGGIYRNVEVRITGANHKPPPPSEMYWQIKEFCSALHKRPYPFLLTDINQFGLGRVVHLGRPYKKDARAPLALKKASINAALRPFKKPSK